MAEYERKLSLKEFSTVISRDIKAKCKTILWLRYNTSCHMPKVFNILPNRYLIIPVHHHTIQIIGERISQLDILWDQIKPLVAGILLATSCCVGYIMLSHWKKSPMENSKHQKLLSRLLVTSTTDGKAPSEQNTMSSNTEKSSCCLTGSFISAN